MRFMVQSKKPSLYETRAMFESFKTFHADGHLAEFGCFDSLGRRQGLYERYFENGLISESSYYKDGLRHGICMKFPLKLDDTNFRCTYNYNDGVRHGPCSMSNGDTVYKWFCWRGKVYGRYHKWKDGLLLRDEWYWNDYCVLDLMKSAPYIITGIGFVLVIFILVLLVSY